MHIGKILLAILVLLTGGSEAVNMWRETRDPLSLAIAVVLIIVLCGLLLRSAFRRRDPSFSLSKGSKVVWTVIGVVAAMSILGQLIEFVTSIPRSTEYVVEVNGLRIPIDDCVNGSANMFSTKEEQISFCTCMATKLASSNVLTEYERTSLTAGRMTQLVQKLKNDPSFDMVSLSECMAESEGAKWTEGMVEQVKKDCITKMGKEGSDKEYDPEQFCDCLVNKIAQYPPSIIASGDSVLVKFQEECGVLSKR